AAFLASGSAFAQSDKPLVLRAPAKVIKTDTIVRNSQTAGKLIAGALPTVPEPFKGVPLAGHKAYFGPMTDYVNGYVRQYLGAHNRSLTTVQGRGNKKFSLIDNVLKQHNIPSELKYLAVIESALNNTAVSPVGAVGPWQLMEAT